MPKAVVLTSGGLDSATCLALASKENRVIAVNFNYGQKHQAEREAAKKLVDFYKVSELVEIQMPDIFRGAGSTLTDKDKPNPEVTYAEIRDTFGVSPTYVPYRNGNLLSAATAVAMVKEADSVWFGAHAEDARNWAYPDCTPEFIGAMANAIYIGTYYKVRLVTPVMWMMKKDIVRLGHELRVPFEITHSCYNNACPACGTCPTCVERKEAFRVNGLVDPIPYVK